MTALESEDYESAEVQIAASRVQEAAQRYCEEEALGGHRSERSYKHSEIRAAILSVKEGGGRFCFWFILVSPSRYSPEAHRRPVRVLCMGVRIRRLIQAGSVWVWLVMWRPCFRFRHPSVRKDAIVSSTSQAVVGSMAAVASAYLLGLRFRRCVAFHTFPALVAFARHRVTVISFVEFIGIQLLRRRHGKSRHPRQRGEPHRPVIIVNG
ncbi:hypothetical protein IGI04_006858 [Brassica rapa subsp. trilocularis]|uniref:Uncharacterized protein n=1 Tax=Brassica rapa subsp. trilocularis TaxID=1813537 RepID=A0ABQ7NI50_BRACM|nr:hypothetical protein IGI04_006858 [Brassica rapa subsp. trilocularis]